MDARTLLVAAAALLILPVVRLYTRCRVTLHTAAAQAHGSSSFAPELAKRSHHQTRCGRSQVVVGDT
jgi:hypothetical protein